MRGSVTLFWVAVDCAGCQERLPLNGVTTGVRCRCGRSVRIPAAFWRRIVEPAVQRADQLPEGVGAPIRLGGDLSIVVIYGRTHARCALCNRPHRLEALAAGPSAGRASCHHCGALASVRQAPRWLRLRDADETLLVGEALEGFLADPLPWYVVRLRKTNSDRPPLPGPPDTDPQVLAPPQVRNVLSLVLTRPPHEEGTSGHLRGERTVELDVADLEEMVDAG